MAPILNTALNGPVVAFSATGGEIYLLRICVDTNCNLEHYCLEPALEMRGVIKKQLCIIDPKEFNVPGKNMQSSLIGCMVPISLFTIIMETSFVWSEIVVSRLHGVIKRNNYVLLTPRSLMFRAKI